MEKEGLAPAQAPRPAEPRPESGARRLQPLSKDFFEAQMEVVIEQRVPVYAAGLGNPGPWIDRLHENGTIVMAVVGAVRHARRSPRAGSTSSSRRATTRAATTRPIGTMALIPQVVDAVGADSGARRGRHRRRAAASPPR